MRSGDWREDPELRELGRELRQRVGGEFRGEAEESERAAAVAAARARSLAQIAVSLRDRGDLVAVGIGRKLFTGTVVYAGADFLSLRTPGRIVHCSLERAITLRVVDRGSTGGIGPGRGPRTFRGRLLELELDVHEVELGAAVLGDVQRGRITAVGRDHVVFRCSDGDEWYVALMAIDYVASRAQGRAGGAGGREGF